MSASPEPSIRDLLLRIAEMERRIEASERNYAIRANCMNTLGINGEVFDILIDEGLLPNESAGICNTKRISITKFEKLKADEVRWAAAKQVIQNRKRYKSKKV